MEQHAVGLVSKKNGDNIPLVGTNIWVNILDVIGEVELEQTYINQDDEPIEATYKFPLNGNNAVHNFVAKIDGNVIVGKVMEKKKAEEVYEDAISAGDGAYLLEQKDDNMLQVSVGNLPPDNLCARAGHARQRDFAPLTAELSLCDSCDDSKHLLFDHYNSEVNVKMPLPIIQISTQPPTLRPTTTIKGNAAELHIPSTPRDPANIPESDLGDISVLVKLGPELGRPRLWVEKWDNEFDPLALMLAVSPSIDLKPQEQEIVFMLDRSSSMDGEPTRQLAYTMFHALKYIPSHAVFNIVSFGSSHKFLFPSSVAPSFENLDAARRLISKLPELGGTDLLQYVSTADKKRGVGQKEKREGEEGGPLEDIYSRMQSGRKRCIVLLTDGRVDNSPECISLAKKNRDNYALCTIGIGDVDQKLVKEMAEEGKGRCEVLSQDDLDNMEATMSGLLQWTLEPAYDRVNIDWFDSNGNICSNVKKAPERLPPIYGGDLYKVYALVSHADVDLVSARLQASGKAGELNIQIDLKSVEVETKVQGKLIHVLAAKQLIRELEEGAFRKNLDPTQQEEEIVRLAIANNLASKYTSFVAVDNKKEPILKTMRRVEVPLTLPRSSFGGGGGGFWRTFGYHSCSAIDTILEGNSFTLEELLEEGDVLQEVKSQNKNIILPSTLSRLLSFITVEADAAAGPSRQFKYPYLACEILSNEIWAITEAFFRDESSLNPPPLSPLLSNYTSRVAQSLLQRRTDETLEYVKNRKGVIAAFISHLGNESVMDVLQKVVEAGLSLEDSSILDWICSTELLPSLLSKLDPSVAENEHENASQVLVNLIITSAHLPASPLIAILESDESINKLFEHILSGNNSVLLHGLSVVIALLRGHAYYLPPSPPSSPLTSSSALPPPLPPLLATSISSLAQFDGILSTSGENEGRTSLGFQKLKIVEFYLSLLCTHLVEQAFVKHGTLQIILDLFFTYHWNNFLHSLVTQIILTVLEGNRDEIKVELLVKAGLLDRIVGASFLNSSVQSKRLAYMGHVTDITSFLVSSPSLSDNIRHILAANSEWNSHVSSLSLGVTHPLGGPLPLEQNLSFSNALNADKFQFNQYTMNENIEEINDEEEEEEEEEEEQQEEEEEQEEEQEEEEEGGGEGEEEVDEEAN